MTRDDFNTVYSNVNDWEIMEHKYDGTFLIENLIDGWYIFCGSLAEAISLANEFTRVNYEDLEVM